MPDGDIPFGMSFSIRRFYMICKRVEINTIPAKTAQMEKAGYIPTAHFILPEKCWTEHFYAPQVSLQEAFLKEHPENNAVKDFIANQRYEQSLYHKYKEYYGYVFYIGQKR